MRLSIRLFLLALFIGLAGCQVKADESLTQINPEQIYQGYPCYEYCDAFEAGFNQAKNQTLTKPSQCSDSIDQEKLGCLAFVQEYKAEHESEFKL